MNKILMALFALGCLALTVFMPWSELGLPAQFLGIDLAPLKGFMNSLPGAKEPVTSSYYVYSLFLGLALTAAAIAINAIGREDSEEVTVLPIKK